MINSFYDEILHLKDISIKENIKITSTMKISAIFKYKLTIYKLHMIKKVMRVIKKYGLKYYFLGNCSNVLFLKDYYDGVIIEVKHSNNEVSILTSGELIAKRNSEYIKKGISSLLFLTLVPTSVGGAIYMNAGAYKKEMKDIIEYVYFYDFFDDKIKVFNNDECEFSYRNSYFKNHKTLILGCKIRLEYLDKDEILKEEKNLITSRVLKLPYNYPSLGSIFKNVDNVSAGKLIDECNLKGARVGDALVSEKHANVIVNVGECRGEDVLSLIEYIQKEVHLKHNKRLELEIILFE